MPRLNSKPHQVGVFAACLSETCKGRQIKQWEQWVKLINNNSNSLLPQEIKIKTNKHLLLETKVGLAKALLKVLEQSEAPLKVELREVHKDRALRLEELLPIRQMFRRSEVQHKVLL